MERRTILFKFGRILLLSGLAGVAGYLAFSGRVTADPDCTDQGKCGSCQQSGSCGVFQCTKEHSNGK